MRYVMPPCPISDLSYCMFALSSVVISSLKLTEVVVYGLCAQVYHSPLLNVLWEVEG